MNLSRLVAGAAIAAIFILPALPAEAAISATRCTTNANCSTGATCKPVPAYVLTGESTTNSASVNACLTDSQYTSAQALIQAHTTTPTGSNTGGGTTGQTLANPLKVDSIEGLLDLVLKAAIRLGSIILTLALIWTGFKFVAARGNEEKIRSARTALVWTVIGGLILLGATAIQAVITSTVSGITS